jgi:hypothetical protein
MVLITFNEDRIINVIEAPNTGITQTNQMVFQGTMKDAEIFFGNKQFDLSKIEDYNNNNKYIINN